MLKFYFNFDVTVPKFFIYFYINNLLLIKFKIKKILNFVLKLKILFQYLQIGRN